MTQSDELLQCKNQCFFIGAIYITKGQSEAIDFSICNDISSIFI